MTTDFLNHRVAGGALGLLIAAFFSVIGVIAGFVVATRLDALQSFSEIAYPAVLALVSGGLGAMVGVLTARVARQHNRDHGAGCADGVSLYQTGKNLGAGRYIKLERKCSVKH